MVRPTLTSRRQEMTKSDTLSITQERAIHLLLLGKTDKKVAEDLEIARQTVTNWRNHDSGFMARLNAERQALWSANQERLRSLVFRAVDILEASLESDNERIRQSSAVQILKMYGQQKLTPGGSTSAEDIELNWVTEANIFRTIRNLSSGDRSR